MRVGEVGWLDLTVPDAELVRDFYRKVVGWESSEVDMGGYVDFNMWPPGAKDRRPVAGVCHARGANADLPSTWLVYIVVENLARSLEACEGLGGEIVVSPRGVGNARYAVVRDPAGAICALFEPGMGEEEKR